MTTPGNHPRWWTEQELELLRQMWPTHTAPEIQARLPHRSRGSIYELSRRMGLQKDPEWNRLRREREKQNLLKHGVEYRFRKGQVSHNKGVKGLTGSHPNTAKNWFKKGRDNGREVPLGTERVNPDGYRERKVDNQKDVPGRHNWKFVHRLLWEEHNGPVPAGDAVVFINGDKTDIRLENLELISRIELMRRNTVHNYPEEVRAAVHASSRLTRVINTLKGKQRGSEEQPG